jgi:DNA-binding transcriptional LysR family regulator
MQKKDKKDFFDFILLRAFSSAAEFCSLSMAATSLGVAQSSLSRQISTLEVELGGSYSIAQGEECR